jgi:hypothetical protein
VYKPPFSTVMSSVTSLMTKGAEPPGAAVPVAAGCAKAAAPLAPRTIADAQRGSEHILCMVFLPAKRLWTRQ